MAISVDFHTLSNSGASHHSLDQANSATVHFLCKWSERETFLDELAASVHPLWGPSCAVNALSASPFSPDQAPSEVMSDPTVDDVAYMQNDEFNCLVTAQYSTDFSLAPWPCDITKPTIPIGTEMVMRVRASSQVIRIPPRMLYSDSNLDRSPTGYVPNPDGVQGRLFLPTAEYQLQWYYVDEPPLKTWEEDLYGRVNETTFLSSEPETILFEGADIEPSTQFQITNPFCFTVTCHFRKRRVVDGENIYGWNHEFEEHGWERVKMENSDGIKVNRYLLEDFSDMFVEATCSSSSSSGS